MEMITQILYWFRLRKWLLIAIALGVLLDSLPTPAGLSTAGYHALVIVITALILLLTEPIPLPGVALYIVIGQVLTGVAGPNEVAASFTRDAVFFIMGSLMLAVAIVGQGLDKRLAIGIIKITGNQTWKIVAGFTAISAILSSFAGQGTVVALLLPVALSLIRRVDADPTRIPGVTRSLLFAIAFGAEIGSIGTPSGGGRNAIMLDYWHQFGVTEVTYVSWMVRVYPMVLVAIPLTVLILLSTFKPERKRLDSAVRRLLVEVSKEGKMTRQNWLAIGVFGLVFLGWIFLSGRFGIGVVALMGVFLYLVLGLVEWDDLNRKTNWGVILLFGAAISIGVQMKETGAAAWLAEQAELKLEALIPQAGIRQHFLAILLSAGMANALSGSATVAVVGPIVLNLGPDLIRIGFISVISSGFGFLTAVAAPASNIIYASGMVKARDFLRAGLKMILMAILILLLLEALWWPLL